MLLYILCYYLYFTHKQAFFLNTNKKTKINLFISPITYIFAPSKKKKNISIDKKRDVAQLVRVRVWGA